MICKPIVRAQTVPLLGLCLALLGQGPAGAQSAHYDSAYVNHAPIPTPRANLAVGAVDGLLYAIGGNTTAGQTGTNEAYTLATNSWQTKASMPTPRELAGTNGAVVNGVLYVIGGNAGGFCTNKNEAYTPATNTWLSKAAMPVAACHLAVVAVGDKVYCIGGTDTSGTNQYQLLQVYTPATDSWSTGANMPTGRSHPIACVLDGQIYVVGGSNPGLSPGPLKIVEIYDPPTNTWLSSTIGEVAELPVGRVSGAAEALNGLVYVTGGHIGGAPTGAVDVYDAVLNAWYPGSPMITPRNGLENDVVAGRILMIGGGNNTTLFSAGSNEALHSRWSSLAPILTPCGNPAAGVVDGVLYVAGGNTVGGQTGTNQAYTRATNSWDVKASMPTPRELAGTNGAVVDGVLYVIGGSAAGFCTNKNEAYTPSTNSWQSKAPMPIPACHLAVVAVGDKVYCIGGTDTSGTNQYQLVQVYAPATDSWSTGANMPTGRSHPIACALDGQIYVVGGSNPGLSPGPLKIVEIYSPSTNSWKSSTTGAVAELPFGRVSGAAEAVNGLVYVSGGNTDGGVLTDVLHLYDPALGVWQTGSPLATPRNGLAQGVVSGMIIAIGGSDSTTLFSAGSNEGYQAPAFTDLHNGKPGFYAPLLRGSGPLLPDEPLAIKLSYAQPIALGAHVIGASKLDLPILGGVLVPSVDILVPFITDFNGAASLALDWPATGTAAGMSVWLQSWMLDDGASFGLAASNTIVGTQP